MMKKKKKKKNKKKKKRGRGRAGYTSSPLFTSYFSSVSALLPSLFLATFVYCVINTVRR
jgi:hypothetical protein